MNEMSLIQKLKLGDLLVEHNILSQDALNIALDEQSRTHEKLGRILVKRNMIDETELLRFLAEQLNLVFLDLTQFRVKKEVVRELSQTYARQFKMIPIDRINNTYLVAASDPTDLYAYDQLVKKLKQPIMLSVAKEQQIMDVVNQVYDATEIASLADRVEAEMKPKSQVLSNLDEMHEAPIKQLLDSLFVEAVKCNASDIHIEPAKMGLRIRYRVDGVLEEHNYAGSTILPALVQRLRLMANLNISEKRLPQDGHFSITANDKKIDVRIATVALQDGESVTLRLLYRTQNDFQLSSLGLPQSLYEKFNIYLKKPYGMILLTGPTGSGKTTTLYASLLALNTTGRKIITVEDPIEYAFDRINQVQIQPKLGLDFSTVLRSLLRHDPDVLMVGEIRDEPTAQMALRAAMTGHLVLSTIHTQNAISAPIRLMDMGVPAYLVSCALQLVVAQRLLKKNCLHCSEPCLPSEFEKKWLSHYDPHLETHGFRVGKGCSHCDGRGYKGRIPVYEFVEMNESLMLPLKEKNDNAYEQLVKKQSHYESMVCMALNLAKTGQIALSEAIRLENM